MTASPSDRRATWTTPSRRASSRRSTRAIMSIAWFGALNEVVARWLLADVAGPARGCVPGAARHAAAVRRRGRGAHRAGDGCPPTAGAVPGGRARDAARRRGRVPAAVQRGRSRWRWLAARPAVRGWSPRPWTLPPRSIRSRSCAAALEAGLEARAGCDRADGLAFVGIGRAWAIEAEGPGGSPRAEARVATRCATTCCRPSAGRGRAGADWAGSGYRRTTGRGRRMGRGRRPVASLVLPPSCAHAGRPLGVATSTCVVGEEGGDASRSTALGATWRALAAAESAIPTGIATARSLRSRSRGSSRTARAGSGSSG